MKIGENTQGATKQIEDTEGPAVSDNRQKRIAAAQKTIKA